MNSHAKRIYSDAITYRSREILQKLADSLDFVLIGRWAVNFYVKTQKSTDVDIMVTADKLSYFKNYGVEKYKGLPIYFAMVGGVRIDIMVQGVSDSALTMPISLVIEESVVVEGIRTASKELLLLLKICGYLSFDRQKVEKDIIDVVSLLFYSNVDIAKVAKYVSRYKIDDRKAFMGMKEYLEKGRNLWEFITNSPEEYSRLYSATRKAIKQYWRG